MRHDVEKAFLLRSANRLAVTRSLFLILACSLALKLSLLVLLARYNPDGIWSPDSHAYHHLALNLLKNGVFSRSLAPPFEAEVFRTPGYPLFLAMIYHVVGVHPLRAIAFQIVLSLATLYLTYRIAERMFNEKVGLIAAGLLALDPVSLLHSQILMTETVFAFFLSLSVFFFLGVLKGERSYAGSGLGSFFLAMATYARPTSYYLGIMIGPLLAFGYWLAIRDWKKAVLTVLVVVVVQAVFVGGWQLRNYLQTGSPEFSQIKGPLLLFERASGIVAIRDGISYEEAQKKLSSLHIDSLPPESGRLTQAQYGDLTQRAGLRIIQEHPVLYLLVAMKGAAAMIFGPSNMAGLFGVDSKEFRTALLRLDFDRFSSGVLLGGSAALAYGIMYLLVLYAGVVMFLRHGGFSGGALILMVVVAYVIVVSSGPEAYNRFRAPIMPLLCVLSSAGYLRVAHPE